MDPTTEVLARTVYDHLCARLADAALSSTGTDAATRYPVRAEVRVVRVRVWETSSSWAEYSG